MLEGLRKAQPAFAGLPAAENVPSTVLGTFYWQQGFLAIASAGGYAFSTPSIRPLKNRRCAKAKARMPGVTTIT
jgi:hypothetical protein